METAQLLRSEMKIGLLVMDPPAREEESSVLLAHMQHREKLSGQSNGIHAEIHHEQQDSLKDENDSGHIDRENPRQDESAAAQHAIVDTHDSNRRVANDPASEPEHGSSDSESTGNTTAACNVSGLDDLIDAGQEKSIIEKELSQFSKQGYSEDPVGEIEEEMNDIINEGLKLLGIARRKTEAASNLMMDSTRRQNTEKEARDITTQASKLFLMASQKAEDAQQFLLPGSSSDSSREKMLARGDASGISVHHVDGLQHDPFGKELNKFPYEVFEDSFGLNNTLSTTSIETSSMETGFSKGKTGIIPAISSEDDLSPIEIENQLLELSQNTPRRTGITKGTAKATQDEGYSLAESEDICHFEDQTSQVSDLHFESPSEGRCFKAIPVQEEDDIISSTYGTPDFWEKQTQPVSGVSGIKPYPHPANDGVDRLNQISHFLDGKMMELAFIAVDVEELQKQEYNNENQSLPMKQGTARPDDSAFRNKIHVIESRLWNTLPGQLPKDRSLDWLCPRVERDKSSRIVHLQVELARQRQKLAVTKKQRRLFQREIRDLKYELLQRTWEAFKWKN